MLSIIIPVLNAKKYLEQCIDSVLAALDGLEGEILLIDNNSTDGSVDIMQEYCKNHRKIIKTLHCDVAGAAAARNFGAREARGDYIWFIDADDYISKDSIMKLTRQAKDKNADLVMMGAERVYQDGHRDYLSAVDAYDKNYKSRFVRYGMGPWQVIVRRKWWLKNGFQFHEGIIHEDMELMPALILYTDKFASVDEPLYFYRQTQNSVLHRRSWSDHAYDIFPALEGLYSRFKVAKVAKKYHDELEWFFIWNLLIDSARDFAQFPEGKPGFKRTRQMLKKYFPRWRKNRFLRAKPLRLRIRVRLNYYK